MAVAWNNDMAKSTVWSPTITKCNTMKCMKSPTIVLLILLLFGGPAGAKDSTKSISNDLGIERAEFGRFPNGKGPRDLKGKNVVFRPSHKVDAIGFSYGWRIKLKTSQKSVHVFEIWDDRKTERGLGDPIKVVDGFIYHDWDVVMGTRKGKHSVEVFIEKQPIKKFVYFVH